MPLSPEDVAAIQSDIKQRELKYNRIAALVNANLIEQVTIIFQGRKGVEIISDILHFKFDDKKLDPIPMDFKLFLNNYANSIFAEILELEKLIR